MVSIFLMITLLTATPAGEFVDAGDTLRLTTARGRVEGSFLRAECGQWFLRDDLGEIVRVSSTHVQRAEVARVVEGSGHGAAGAAIAGFCTFAVGIVIASNASSDHGDGRTEPYQIITDRDAGILLTFLLAPAAAFIGYTIGNDMAEIEWRPVEIPCDDPSLRHGALLRELHAERAAARPARPKGLSWSRSF